MMRRVIELLLKAFWGLVSLWCSLCGDVREEVVSCEIKQCGDVGQRLTGVSKRVSLIIEDYVDSMVVLKFL